MEPRLGDCGPTAGDLAVTKDLRTTEHQSDPDVAGDLSAVIFPGDFPGDDRWAWPAFAAAAGLLVLFVIALALPQPPASYGMPHPEVEGLLHGGSGPERHGGRLGLGWAIGGFELLFFLSLIALGTRQRADLRGLGKPLMLGGAVYVAIWTLLMVAYGRYLGQAEPSLVLALPEPTAVMLYLLYPMPAFFIALYVIGFRRWVLTEDDQAAFDRLVLERRSRSSSSDAEDRR